MLTPEEIQALKEYVSTIADPINSFLIEDICRRIAKTGRITATAEYQTFRAQTLGTDFRDIQKEIAARLNVSASHIDSLFDLAAQTTYDNQVKIFGAALVPFEKNGALQQIVRASKELAIDDLGNITNITKTLGMVATDGQEFPLKKFYAKTMDYVHNNVSTGAMSYIEAIRSASTSLAERGVTSIGYQSGQTTSLEAAMRRNVMGGLGLMAENISNHNHDKLGATGWEMSAHAMSAEDHEPYQGKQYTNADWIKLNGKPPLPGQPANKPEIEGILKRRIGTLHCGHNAFPIIIGINKPQWSDEQLQKFKTDNANGVTIEGKHYTMYKATQRQRHLEARVRHWKRRNLAATASDDEEMTLHTASRLNRVRRAYLEFSKAAGLRVQQDRLYVAGFGRSQAGKAVWANRKAGAA